MLEMCHNKRKSCRDHVLWGYSLYSSNGSFDMSHEESMRLGDVKDLLGTMVRVVYRSDMVELSDAAFTSVASFDSTTKAMVKKQQHDKKPLDDIKIDFRVFELMLKQPMLKPLFQHARAWGKKDPGTWTYLMEEKYYHPTLFKYIMAERRSSKVEELADIFVRQKSKRRKRDAMKLWKGYM